MTQGEFFAHPAAIVESSKIGRGTRIWAFAHVLAGADVGAECNICDHVFIENEVVIGDRVTVKCGVQLWNGVTIEDDVFVGPNATFTNDRFPRSKRYPDSASRTVVCKGASVGANATILPGIRIGKLAMVGAGAVVTRDVPDHAIVVGNPARIEGYVETSRCVEAPLSKEGRASVTELRVQGVRLYELPVVRDLRGALTFGEINNPLPFAPQRYFVIFDVPTKEVRGVHAHRELHEFLVCLRGQVSVVVDDGKVREEVVLGAANIGLYIPNMIWTTLYRYSPDALVLVLASDVYKAADYIRNYDEYLPLKDAHEE